jgi:hypothetical protein
MTVSRHAGLDPVSMNTGERELSPTSAFMDSGFLRMTIQPKSLHLGGGPTI